MRNPPICTAHLVPANHCALLHHQWPNVTFDDLIGEARDLNTLYAEYLSGDLTTNELPDLINALVEHGFLLPAQQNDQEN